MREFAKVASVLVIAAAIFTVVFAWADDRPNRLTWVLRITPCFVGLAALGVFLRLHFQRDRAPDYLTKKCGRFFDRGGFCFAITLENMNGVCILHTYFQNRFEKSCLGRIALRPTDKFFQRTSLSTIAMEILCDGGAFGVHRVPKGVPPAVQGETVQFQVGAYVSYPDGRGKMLRFRDGILLRTDTDFGNSFATSLQIAGALGGVIVLSRPATTTLSFPLDVAQRISPDEIQPHTTVLWRPGDDEL